MSEQTKPESDNAEAALTPGEALRQAREKYGLSEEDVAAELNLAIYQIRALEENRFQELPGETYVRGYMKSYARLLNTDETALLESIGQQENAAITSIRPIIRETRSTDRHMKLLSLGVIAVLGGLMYMWWQSRDQSAVVPLKAVDAVDQEQLQSANPDYQRIDQFAPLAEQEEEMQRDTNDLQPEQNTDDPEAHAEDANGDSVAPASMDGEMVAAVQTQTLPGSLSDEPEQIAPQLGGEIPADAGGSTQTETTRDGAAGDDGQEQTSQQEPEVAAVSEQPAPAVEEVQSPENQLQSIESESEVNLVFSATSWVDLRDANGQRLLYENVSQGREVSVRGKAPFSVFLGNAEGVQIQYDGQPFDFSAFTNGIYARFELGTEHRN